MRQYHALTPGDHYSPRTGSAVATVVHGLATHTVPRPAVLVAQGTYRERYSSADVVEYQLHHSPHGASPAIRAIDVALGRAALPRPWSRRIARQVLAAQDAWDSCFVIGHNAPQLVPLVSDRHAATLYVHNDLLSWYTAREASRVLKNVHRVICVSAYTASRVAEKLKPQLRERIRIVHNGVELRDFSAPRTGRSDNLRVGYVGRVIPRKGVHVLLEAVAMLRRRDIDVEIVGSSGFDSRAPLTSYEEGLRGMAHCIPGRVRFTPFQPRNALPAILATFDVTVVPSVESEAFALTVLEGMAAGSVVVASAIGGIPEAAGHAALLVEPGHVGQLASAIEAMADDPELMEELADRGRSRAHRMSWEHSSAQLARALQ